MRIVITTVQAPFISGGAEFLAQNLRSALLQKGHEAEIVSMPFMDNPISMIEDHIVAARLMNVAKSWAGEVDLCIGLKFPAYFMPHPNKVVWALHQYRGAYELFNSEYSLLKNDPEGNTVKKCIVNTDNLYLNEAKRIYTISQNVADRMKKNNDLNAQSLYHPCPDMDMFYAGGYGDYILMPSRINITKRQLLAVEAMTHSKTGVKLYIMGGADHEYEKKRLLDKIRELRLNDRVKYLGAVEQREKIRLYAEARAVLFIPYDEDYGYIALESMAAARAVITARDSGGPLEFITDNQTGIIAEPDAKSLAYAIDSIANSPKMAEAMGTTAKKRLIDMNISWDAVVKELTK